MAHLSLIGCLVVESIEVGSVCIAKVFFLKSVSTFLVRSLVLNSISGYVFFHMVYVNVSHCMCPRCFGYVVFFVVLKSYIFSLVGREKEWMNG